ncbi:MAG: ATP-binding cassette domain-containing protein [Oscillospiraceae bacterium]|jgi:peptide/nickel transport system ATP-binding protein|nr:ATP-binding cassette domain-containing protein [Oscillospiraceae bacterium]
MSTEPLLRIKNLKKYFVVEKDFFGRPSSVLKAVDEISFDIYKGEAFGLVGESGCGKSTIGKMIVNIYKPTSGSIIFEGKDLNAMNKSQRRSYCKHIQLIFQDPYASLNPRMTVGEIVSEPIYINKLLPNNEIEKRVNYLLNCVGLSSSYRDRYVHEFSGGQRQRVGIARAIALNPKLIVCDEPVSALDVSIQAQVINLLDDLKKEFSLTYLFIAHGLNVVKHISDRVGVMYLGKMMEIANKKDLYENPLNPYTQALMSAIPSTDLGFKKERIRLKGDVPSPINPPAGCRFCTRCFKVFEGCDTQSPLLSEIRKNHYVACRLFENCQEKSETKHAEN